MNEFNEDISTIPRPNINLMRQIKVYDLANANFLSFLLTFFSTNETTQKGNTVDEKKQNQMILIKWKFFTQKVIA